MNGNYAIYFVNFEVEHFPKETKKFIGNKNIITNIYRLQAYDSNWTGFIDFMFKSKNLLDYTNLFSANGYQKNDKIILKYFQ